MSDPSSSVCRTCGTPLDAESSGTCPRCLMLAAMEPTAHSAEAMRQPPPSIAAVKAAFPQLEILELIGQGGMGCVFKARQPKLDRLVALKLLPASLAEGDAAFADRFEREGQLLARLHHPNIVAVHDSGTAGDFFYLIMEYVDGVNLRQAMRARRFAPAQALAIVPYICDALQFAHDEGVLHRDIKPENILLDAKGRVKLADFGIAKLLADSDTFAADHAPADAGLTQSGIAPGTPSYMAPEQRDTPGAVDHRADIYSLGVVFYELLTGELPVGRFAPPSAISAADPRVDAIVRQALEKDREHRQHSAGEVKTQVETLAQTQVPSIAASKAAFPWKSVVMHGLLAIAFLFAIAFIAPRMLATLTEFLSNPRDLPLVPRCVAAMSRHLPICVVAMLAALAADAGLCIVLSRKARAGLWAWNIGIALIALTGFTVFSLGMWLPIRTVIQELAPQPVANETHGIPVAANTEPSPEQAVSSLPTPASPPASTMAAQADLQAVFAEYEQLLTALREATFELDLADFSEGTDAERAARRANIATRCDGLAERTMRLREKILALGKRATEPRDR